MYVQVKVAVIYHGETEQVYRLALAATDAAWDAGGEVRVRRVGGPLAAGAVLPDVLAVPEATAADLAWADVALFGTAAPDGVVVDRLRQFVDAATPLWRTGQLAGKVFGAFTASAGVHGGAGSRLATLADVFQQWGGMVVPLRPTDPGPRPTGWWSAARRIARGAPSVCELAAARALGRRALETARTLKARRLLAEVA